MAASYNRGLALNPSIPPFEPQGREMTLLPDHMLSTPRAAFGGPLNNNDMAQLIFQCNSNMTREIIGLERRTESVADDVKSVTETFRSDMRSLQSMIYSLQRQVNTLEEKHTGDSETNHVTTEKDEYIFSLVRAFKTHGRIAPDDALKTLAGSKEDLAEAYLAQAEDTEELAAKLREHAHILLGDVVTSPTSNATKLIQGPRSLHSTDGEKVTGIRDVNPGGPTEQSNVDHRGEGVAWAPRAVHEMPKYASRIPDVTEPFTWSFLTSQLGGEKWSPGFYFVGHDSVVKSKGYWVLEADWEPFLPESPGQNGAKLTVFFNDTLTQPGKAPTEENYMDTPVFIRPKNKQEYYYFGQYSQTRFSDKLDYDRVTVTVPEHVRHGQAEQLADPRRPEWVTRALMHNFWPKPEYDGPLPQDSDDEKSKSLVSEALWEYAENLAEWERDARMKVKLLTTTALTKAFEHADADEEPGLRMHWEYMQCVAFDQPLYDLLVQRKRNLGSAKNSAMIAPHGSRQQDQPGTVASSYSVGTQEAKGTEEKLKLRNGDGTDVARRYREFAQLGQSKGDGKSLRH